MGLVHGSGYRVVNNAGNNNLEMVSGQFHNSVDTLDLARSGQRVLVGGVAVATGANGGDIVVGNAEAYRFLNNAGTSSANYRIASGTSDEIVFGVPATTSTFAFQFAGTNRLRILEENAGAGIIFDTESSSDHAAPSANRCVIYTRDNGGDTELVARFNTGTIKLIATEA